MKLKIKRVYDRPAPDDGYRVLVDRVWPRGVRKEGLKLDAWEKELAPSADLRRWFGHDPERWEEFRERYLAELARSSRDAVNALRARARTGGVTLLFGARDDRHNNAVVLAEYLRHPRPSPPHHRRAARSLDEAKRNPGSTTR